MDSSNAHYTAGQRRLHWLVVGLVLAQYPAQQWLTDAHQASVSGTSVTVGQFALITLHTLLGLGIGVAVWARLALRRRAPVLPGARDQVLGWRRAILWYHRGLYLLLLAMVFSGAMHYYFGLELAGRVHEIGKWVLAGMLAVHVLGALVHRFIRGDEVLQRMLG